MYTSTLKEHKRLQAGSKNPIERSAREQCKSTKGFILVKVYQVHFGLYPIYRDRDFLHLTPTSPPASRDGLAAIIELELSEGIFDSEI